MFKSPCCVVQQTSLAFSTFALQGTEYHRIPQATGWKAWPRLDHCLHPGQDTSHTHRHALGRAIDQKDMQACQAHFVITAGYGDGDAAHTCARHARSQLQGMLRKENKEQMCMSVVFSYLML